MPKYPSSNNRLPSQRSGQQLKHAATVSMQGEMVGGDEESSCTYFQSLRQSFKQKIWQNRAFYKGFNVAAVLVNPLISFFLFMAIYEAADDIGEGVGLDDAWFVNMVVIFAAIFSLLDASDEVLVVNPIEEAIEMATPKEDNLSFCQYRRFIWFNQMIANSTYVINATSDVMGFIALFSSPVFFGILEVLCIILGLPYDNMLTAAKINEHSHEFMKRLLDGNTSMVWNAIKSPFKSLEFMILTLDSAFYRAIMSAAVVLQLLTLVFNVNTESMGLLVAVLYAGISTFYTSLFSRTLNVYHEFFDPRFEGVSIDVLQSARVSGWDMFQDTVMGLLRGVASGVLLYRYGLENPKENMALSGSAGVLVFSHYVYTRYQQRKYQAALEQDVPFLPVSLKIRSTGKERFQQLQEDCKTPCIKNIAWMLDAGGRSARWVAFLAFLLALKPLLKSNTGLEPDFVDLLCVQQLLCTPALENEFSFYRDHMVDNLAYYFAKYKINRQLSPPISCFAAFFKETEEYDVKDIPDAMLIHSRTPLLP